MSQCPKCGRAIAQGTMCPACLLGLALPSAPVVRKSTTLPHSLLQDGVERMGWVGLALALTSAGVMITGYLLQPGWVDPEVAPLSYVVAMLGIAASGLALFVLARLRRTDLTGTVDIGLVLQVIAGFFISLGENSIAYTGAEPVHGNSSVAVWIIVFALAVPVSFGRSLTAALATASMGPIGLGIQVLLGNVPSPPAPLWFVLFSSQYLMAGAAALLGRLIYRLGAEVKAAREYGGYELVSRLGSGGMGEVWKARHHLIGREAAVKLIRPELFGSDALAAQRRFEREASATAALHSPHTVSLYNYGLSEDGLLYYVMELLHGYDLDILIGRYGPVPPARAVHILTQVCDSLAEAHAHGLIHRDIKPGNILLCPMGTSGDFVKVLDFGLVQDADSKHSLAGGTPGFMAPEVLAGQPADARADIYSLGCVARWLLGAGSEDLEEIVTACLENDPAKRPQSAPELADRLSACRLPQPWTHSDAEQWWAGNSPAL